MATQKLMNPRPYKKKPASEIVRGGVDDIYFKEAATQTWKIGSLVYGDANGETSICTNSSQKLNGQVLGQALTAGRNLSAAAAATSPIGAGMFQVRIIQNTDIFIANVYHTTAASAITAQTDMWDRRGLYYVSATGLWHVDYVNAVEGSADAGASVQIIGFPDVVDGVKNTLGDVYGFVLIRFLNTSIAGTGTLAARPILQYSD